jgi:mannose-6-phosphate isomerase-like protein (cupin superfamily)
MNLSLKQRWARRGFTSHAQTDPPGKHWRAHVHAVDEIVALDKGRIQVWVGKKKRKPRAGQDVIVPRRVKHAIWNIGPTSAHYWYGFRSQGRHSAGR